MVRRSSAALIAAALLVLVPASAAVATVRIRGVNVSEFPDVSITVSTDSEVPPSRANVSVRENGIPVTVSRVASISAASQHVDVVLLIDISNSMRGQDLRTALAAAKEFVARVPDWLPVGIVSFAASPHVVSPISSDRVALGAAVDGMGATTSQGTALYDAIRAGATLFTGRGQHNLIVLTDGRNTSGSASIAEAVASANKAGVNVFTLGLSGPDTNEAALHEIASETDGAYRSLSPADLDAAYRSLAEQLGQQFVVTYRSKVPYAMPATVVVTLPDGSAQTKFLVPAYDTPPTQGSETISSRIFDGDVGMGLAVLLTFVAVLSLLTVSANVGRTARRRRFLESRLLPGGGDADRVPAEPVRPTVVPRPIADAVEKGADAAGASRSLSAMMARAGWSLSVGEFLVPAVLLPVALAGLAGATGHTNIAVVALVLLIPLPFVVLARAGRKRLNRIQEQLPDVLMILASSLRAGHSLLQALDSVAKEIDEPASAEFARALSEIRLGRNMDDALTALATRVGGQDLEWAVTAINIQRKVGGNLAEVLETVAGTIRERQTLRRQVKVLSAEGRLSVTILIVLPFVIALYLALVNPDYVSALTGTVAGIAMLTVSIILMIVGFVWMRKVVRLDV